MEKYSKVTSEPFLYLCRRDYFVLSPLPRISVLPWSFSLGVTQSCAPKSRRTIALSPTVCILLGQLKERQIGERLLLGLKLQDDDLVFSKPDGDPLDPSTVTHNFGRMVKRAGLNARFHDLRHTYATLMLAAGVHAKIVSEALGHSTVAITLDIYSHVTPGLQEAAAKQLDSLLPSG